jgi:SAM-dependent methyltransferase
MIRVCHVCESDRYRTLYRPAKSPGPVVQCEACGFVYVNPIQDEKSLIQDGPILGDRPASFLESADLSLIPGNWEAPIIESYMREAPAKRENAREALSHLEGLLPERGRILDFGCFCGLFLDVAAQQGWDAYGLEPLVIPSIYARGTFGLNITTDTLHEDSFPADFFDLITSFQVFEHIVNPVPEIEKLKGFLKPGGYIMIEVPNIDSLGVRILGSRHRHYVEDHVSFFSGDTLPRFLDRSGFDVCEVYYPKRALGLPHLAWWLGKVTHPDLGEFLGRMVHKVKLEDKMLTFGVGDIVSVIGRKR